MRYENIKEGMAVKYYNLEQERYYIATVVEKGWIIDYGQKHPNVVVADPSLNGGYISVGTGNLKPYLGRGRDTHCWNCHENHMTTITAPLCAKCDGIFCPKCGECLCKYKKMKGYSF